MFEWSILELLISLGVVVVVGSFVYFKGQQLKAQDEIDRLKGTVERLKIVIKTMDDTNSLIEDENIEQK